MQFLQLLLALSLIILIHEFGHFFFAKIFGIRVDKFYLFFDAGGFRLFSTKNNPILTRLFPRLKDAETDYGIGWLPLGGYCKISGMVDESMDKEQLAQAPKDYEFRTHPAWQRLLVMFGGVLMNFLLATAIFTGMVALHGEAFIPNEGNAICTNELSREMGFRDGDRVLLYDDYAPAEFNALHADLARKRPSVVTVLRGTDTVRLHIDYSLMGKVIESPDFFTLALPFVVDSIPQGSLNDGCPLQRGDSLILVDGKSVKYVQQASELFSAHKGGSVDVQARREGNLISTTLQVDSTGRVGIFLMMPQIQRRSFTLAESVPEGFRVAFKQIKGYLQDLRLVASPSTGAYKSVGSFISIGQAFPKLWDWDIFFNIVAMLNIMLFVMNLLPVPGLDGGHIAFTLFEIFTGRKPSERFLMTMQFIGMILLLMLMVLAFGNDITRLVK